MRGLPISVVKDAGVDLRMHDSEMISLQY